MQATSVELSIGNSTETEKFAIVAASVRLICSGSASDSNKYSLAFGPVPTGCYSNCRLHILDATLSICWLISETAQIVVSAWRDSLLSAT